MVPTDETKVGLPKGDPLEVVELALRGKKVTKVDFSFHKKSIVVKVVAR